MQIGMIGLGRMGANMARRLLKGGHGIRADAESEVVLSATARVTAAFGLTAMDPEEKMIGEPVELLASRYPDAEEMNAYERVLGDAIAGDPILFAREDYVEEAWRIVDPVLKAGTPVYDYEPNSWGPREVDQSVSPPGGWHNPVVNGVSKNGVLE